MNKKGVSSYIYLLGAIAFIVIIGILFNTTILPTNKGNSGDGWQVTNPEEGSESMKGEAVVSDQNKTTVANTNSEETGGGSGGGSGGGGGGEGGSEGSGSCTTRQLIYTIQGNFKNETCVEFDAQNNCIKKTVFCSASIKNNDIATGDFQLRLVFVEDTKDKETEFFGEQIQTFTLGPGESQTMQSTETVQSTGETGLANQIINCFFNTVGSAEACV